MLNPQLNAFLSVWDKKWADLAPGGGPAERRAHFEKIAEEMRLETPQNVQTSREEWINTPAGKVRVRFFRYADDRTQPCLIYMHGGAWMQGSPETHWDITSRIAAWNQQTVISVDYDLAPEHPFPAAFDQCLAVTRWAYANASHLGIDANHIVIGGDSAGANLAAAVALVLRGEIKLAGQLLIYPPVDFEGTRPAYTENAEAPLLQTRGMQAVNAMYCPNPEDLRDPRAAPMFATDHSGLPPTFIGVAQYDPLRDDGIDYARKLEASGVSVILDRGEGLIHGYLRAMQYCTSAHEKLEEMAAWLRGICTR